MNTNGLFAERYINTEPEVEEFEDEWEEDWEDEEEEEYEVTQETQEAFTEPQPQAVPSQEKKTAKKELSFEDIAKLKSKGEIKRKIRERVRESSVEDYILNSDDLIIVSSPFLIERFIINNTKRIDELKHLSRVSLPLKDKDIEKEIDRDMRILNDTFIFDKYLNPLIEDFSYWDIPSSEMYPKTFVYDTDMNTRTMKETLLKREFYVIDKKSFLESKGKIFKLKYRRNVPYKKILNFKERIIQRFINHEKEITELREKIEEFYNPEDFEIINDFSAHTGRSNIMIYFQFKNLIIENSIEIQHLIDNLLVRMGGYIDNKRIHIYPELAGRRIWYNPIDLQYGYNHSHIPSGINSLWNYFCMGNNHFMSFLTRDASIDDIELESLLLGLKDHISWESLEGGPYYRMESIGHRHKGIIFEKRNTNHLKDTLESDIKTIINTLKVSDLTGILNAFELYLNENNEFTYGVDSKRFIIEFLNLFDEKYIREVNTRFGGDSIIYDPDKNEFYRKGELIHFDFTSEEKLKIDGENILNRYIKPFYMNRTYIEPKIILNGNYSSEKTHNESFHPTLLNVFSKYIQYFLIKELNNEREKRK